MTQIMSHGKWVPYQPDKLPEFMPPNTLFARRESDGVDWYDYVRDPKNFIADSVKFTVMKQNSGWIIGAAVREPDRLHPADQMVLEVIDYHGGDPQAELGGRGFDLVTNKLLDRPPLPPNPNPILDIWDRLAVIEAKLGIQP